MEASEAHARRGLELDGVPASLAMIMRANLGDARRCFGDFDGALAHGLAAQREAARIGPQAEAATAVLLCDVYQERGDLPAVRRLLEQHTAQLDGVDARRASRLWGMLLEDEGVPAQALVRFQEGAAFEDEPAAAWCLAGAARSAVAAGELTVAREALARLER